MSRQFEWRAEEDLALEEQDQLPNWAPRRRLPRWLLLLVLVPLIIGAALFLYVRQRTLSLERQLKADVTATHALTWKAALAVDLDVLDTLLVPESGQWRRKQLTLARAGMMTDRVTLGLRASDAADPTDDLQVSLDEAMDRAVVTFTLPFVGQWTPPPVEAVDLEFTAFYEREGESWLRAPPPDEDAYWGSWERAGQAPLIVVVPGRDAATGQRLASDLGQIVQAICSATDITCPGDFTLQLKFDRDASSLARINGNSEALGMTRYEGVYHMTMPAPSLIGRPVDENGYQALNRGYANWLATVLVRRFGAGELASGDEQFLAARLAKWDLDLPPFPRRPLPALRASQGEPGEPWPAEDLILLCRQPGVSMVVRYRPQSNAWEHLVDPNRWPELRQGLAEAAPLALVAAPDGRGVFLFTLSRDGTGLASRVLWLADEAVAVVVETDSEVHPLSEGYRATSEGAGDRLVVYEIGPDPDGPQARGAWLNLRDCLAGTCSLNRSNGYPFWSADGQRTVLLDIHDGAPMLSVGDGSGLAPRPLGMGMTPRWLDEDTLSFVTLSRFESDDWTTARSGLATAVLLGDEVLTTTLVTAEELRPYLPEERRDRPLLLQDAMVHPEDRAAWFLTAFDGLTAADDWAYLFLYEHSDGQIRLLRVFEDQRLLEPMRLQAGERYLSQASLSYSPGGSPLAGVLTILDLTDMDSEWAARSYRFASDEGAYAWSGDGRWLALAQNGAFRLVAPGVGFERVVSHELAGCNDLVWLARQDGQ